MAYCSEHINLPPERVFSVLADSEAYDQWVVGAKRIRRADPGFPAQGTRFHHTVGFGPISVEDHTEVLAVDPPRLLKLKAKARPAGTFVVELRLESEGVGTRVHMTEEPGDALTRWVFGPLSDLLVRGRNMKSLERLKRLAEGRSPGPAGGARHGAPA